MNNRIVLTAGPGSGKTSVIEYLNSLGYLSAPEAGRKIIKAQVESKGSALPWIDKAAFRDVMVLEEISNYERFGNKDITFFDRSIIDAYGYSKLENIPIPDLLISQCREMRYIRRLFIFPPWRSIYKNDIERKQSFREAVSTYDEMVVAYDKFGYVLIEVPKKSVGERVDFILDHVRSGQYPE